MTGMTTEQFQQLLAAMVETVSEDDGLGQLVEDHAGIDGAVDQIRGTRTYREAGMLTYDDGLVVMMRDGSEFRMTIHQVRR